MLREIASSIASRSARVSVGGISARVETRNAPVGAYTSSLWSQPGMPQMPKWDAERAIQSAYLSEIFTYRCVESISHAITGLPFRAGYDPESPSDYSLNTPLATLLGPPPGSPNPLWTGREVLRYSVAQYLLAGKFAWLKEYDGSGRVIGLWPLQAQYLTPISAKKGAAHYFSGYRYSSNGGQYIDYRLDQVVYCWKKSTEDPRHPETVLQAGATKVGVNQMLARFDYNFYKNNGVPSTIVTTEPFAEPEQRKAFREQFVDNFGGSENAGKTLFLEADPDESSDGSSSNNVASKISVERLGLTAREAQLDAKSAEIKRDICLMWGVPMSVLGDSSERTFSNAGNEWRAYWSETLIPKTHELEDQINLALAPELDRSIVGWFDMRKVKALQPEQAYAPSNMVELHKLGIITRDEMREELSLRPWDEVEHDDEVDGVKEAPPALPAAPIMPALPATPVAPPALPAEARHSGEGHHSTSTGGHLTKNTDHVQYLRAMEKLLTAQLQKILEDQRVSVQTRASGKRGRQGASLSDLLDPGFWETRITSELAPTYIAVSEFLEVPEGRASALAQRVVEDTGMRLHAAMFMPEPAPQTAVEAIDEAFGDIGSRARALAKQEISSLGPVTFQDLVIQIIERAS